MNPLSPAEAKELIRLCEAGRLYEVEAWISAGKSLIVPKEVRKAPLNVAMATGFHSLVELLLRHEGSQEVKNDALRQALFLNRPAFVELALAHGADFASIPFLDVLMTGDRAVVASFLQRGADPIADYPFAHAFHQLRVKTTQDNKKPWNTVNLVAHGCKLEWTVGGNLSEKCWEDLRTINLHWHDLRHEALSRLGESGELSDHELMEIAGHANLTTTQRYLNTRIERLKQGVLRAAAKGLG